MTIARERCAAMVVGGPTVILDLGGLRVVSDPTFDAPGPHGYLTKTEGPAVAPDELGPVDLVLVSHDNHPDNLDDSVRAAAAAGIVAPGLVIPAHYDGWAHFSEGRADLARAFDEAGLAARLALAGHGSWIPLDKKHS